MMMISNSRRRSRAAWGWAAALALLLAGLLWWRTSLGEALWQALAPLSVTRLTSSQEQASTTAALADRGALYQENLQLKAMLGRDGSVPRVLAGVIERPPQTPYDSLVIDAGTAEGIAPGQWVGAAGGAVIGSISEVGAHTARVELLSSPGATYQGLLTHAGVSVPLSLAGQGGGSLMAQVPAGTAVSVGDPVFIPGVVEGIEGVVSSVAQKTGESFETVYLHLPVDPSQLQFVEVWQTPSAH